MVNTEIAGQNAGALSGRTAAARAAPVAAALVLLSLGVFGDAAASMASIWLSSSVYHHGAVVPLLSLWMIRRQGGLNGKTPVGDWTGVAFLFAASSLWLFGRAASADILGHLAIVIAIIGAVVAVYGREIARQWAFALGFLFFMVPFGEELTPVLQDWATGAVKAMLDAAGVENTRDGFMLTTGAGRFQMAESCAGLRFILAAAMIATLVSGLAFSGWRKRILFITSALAVAVIANWLRAFLLVFAATLTNRKIGVGPEHVALGWAFYGFVLFALIGIARKFSDPAARGDREVIAPHRPGANARAVFAASALAMLAAAAYDAAILSSPRQPHTTQGAADFVPAGFSPSSEQTSWAPYAPGADKISIVRYASGGRQALVGEAYFYADRADAEIGGADMRAADGDNWRRIAVSRLSASAEAAHGDFLFETLRNSAGEQIDVVTIYRLGGRFIASRAALKAQIALRKLGGASTEGGALFIAMPHDGERSRAALRAIIEKAPLFARALPSD